MVTVVTGASGFVGGVLVRALIGQGRRVRAVDTQRGPALADLDVDWAEADMLDRSSLREVLQDADVVFHLAAVISVTGDPTGRVWAVNVGGVQNVAEAALAAGVRRFVHCSSVHAFNLRADVDQITETGPRATDPLLPVYDRSKAAGEAALRRVIDAGLNAVIVNPTGIIGPMDFAPSRMGGVLLALFRRRLPAVVAGGFDWVDVRDVVTSMLAAEARGRTGENYLLPGHNLSLAALAEIAEEVAGRRRPSFTLPMWFARLWSPLANAVSRRTQSPLWYTSESMHALRFNPPVSGARADQELGHHSRPIRDTIADTYEWFASRGRI